MTAGEWGPSPARHCWLEGAPALLTEWRRGPGDSAGWEGRVVSVQLVDGAWSSVTQWVPADRIAPA